MLRLVLHGHDGVLWMTLSSRVTLLLLGVSIAEISAGAHRDLQAGNPGVVAEGKFQLSRHTDALKHTAVCAVAAVAALRGVQHKQKAPVLHLQRQNGSRDQSRFLIVLSSYPLPS